jgi:hypothetical protein
VYPRSSSSLMSEFELMICTNPELVVVTTVLVSLPASSSMMFDSTASRSFCGTQTATQSVYACNPMLSVGEAWVYVNRRL